MRGEPPGMADPVAIVSIVSGATVAITVPFISAALERARLARQSAQERLEELRALLDACVLRFSETMALLADFEQGLGHGRLDAGQRRFQELRDAFTAKNDEVFRHGLLLSMRVGSSHPLAQAHKETVQVSMAYQAGLAAVEAHPDAAPPAPPYLEFSNAMFRFMDTIAPVIGPTLPPVDRAAPL